MVRPNNRRATVAQLAQELNAGLTERCQNTQCFCLQYVEGQVRWHRLPGEHMAPGCTTEEGKPAEAVRWLWAMFCWKTLGLAIHVEVPLTHTTYLSIVADHAHPFMETVFLVCCVLFLQDNAPCDIAKMVQESFEEHEFEVLTWPPNS